MSNQYTLSQLSLNGNPTLKEVFTSLWRDDSSNANFNATSSGSQFLQFGNTVMATSATSASAQLYTHSSSWDASQEFELETVMGGSNGTVYAALWDMTSNTIVSASQVSTATAANRIRSGKFTLTPGHVYGVTGWIGSTGYNNFTSASLVTVQQ